MRRLGLGLLVAAAALSLGAAACGEADAETITVESWRAEDAAVWEDLIIPAFEREFPAIEVVFVPTSPTEYDAALEERLAEGTAGDVIACRAFDTSLALFERSHLAPLADLPGIEAFGPDERSAWAADGGIPYCVPVASVIHGFVYNRTAFGELGLREPRTEEEFFGLLEAIRDEGSLVPLAMGTRDRWEAATMGFQSIGPNYWKGEQGRLALIDGSAKLTDQPYVDTLTTLQRWSQYLPSSAPEMTHAEARAMFTAGDAAIYPAGSWEIAALSSAADFELGAFAPPPPAGQDTCYISDHTDIGLGMNAATDSPQAARTLLTWATSRDFARIFANALPGFFTLRGTPADIDDPLAREFASWRDNCESTIRNTAQFLSRGEPGLEHEAWAVSAAVLTGGLDPISGAQRLQASLDSWYDPPSQPANR
ncbi:MAG: ABC transporter substrate-binding protein [Acidimicrobiaceae bacterium]|nr:ABC transporter substrate-binding protein [Acidimicrobiaceae bacterium]